MSIIFSKYQTPLIETKYTDDEWYGDIYHYLLFAKQGADHDRLRQLSLQCKASDYRLIEGDLLKNMRGVMKRCIVTFEVASVLEAAHNLEGHWQF